MSERAKSSRIKRPRSRVSPAARKAQILGVVEQLFVSRPYAEVGVADVAREVGITQGLVYHYFPTKQALLVAAVEHGAEELLRYCVPPSSLPLPEQIRLGVAGYLDYVEAHERAYLNLFRGPSLAEPEVLRICERARIAIVDRFIVGLGQAKRALPATRASMRGYIGYAESVTLGWIETRSITRKQLERLCHSALVAALRAGLAAEKAPPLSPKELDKLDHAYRRHLEPG